MGRKGANTSRMASACGALLVGLVVLRPPLATAEEAEQGSEKQPEQTSESATDLEREFNDPLTTLPQFFLQDAYTPANYGLSLIHI